MSETINKYNNHHLYDYKAYEIVQPYLHIRLVCLHKAYDGNRF